MIVVEYYIKGESGKHSRYFSTIAAARNFCSLMQNDPDCVDIRLIN